MIGARRIRQAMASLKTKERILRAAEELFADHGFSGTSLRQLTKLADVNLAAVNYHFGSKENLIAEVFKRRLDELGQARSTALDEVVKRHGDNPPLDEVLRAFIYPALHLTKTGSPFVKVLARAFVEYRNELRAFLSKRYGELNRRFFELFARHLSGLDEQQIFWRIEFMIGALTYTMADFGANRRPVNQLGSLSDEKFWQSRAEELVAFAAAGLMAEADSTATPSLSEAS